MSESENRDVDAILESVLSGDVDAYQSIVKKYQRSIWSLCAYYLHDRLQIAEAVDASFVKAYFALDRFELGRSFEAWIKSIARNEVRMVLRKMVREEKAVAQYVDRVAAETALTDIEAEKDEGLKEYLDDCLKILSEQQQELLCQRYDEEKSISQIASECQRSSDAVKKNLSRIRGRLRICIEKKVVQNA